MRVRILLVAACLAAFAEPLFAQGWREALERQDYATASRLLHQAVLALPAGQDDPDPLAAEHIGLLYARGLGVPSDPVLACSLLRWASFAAHGHEATSRRLSAAASAQCGTLAYEDRADAADMTGCLVFDVPAETFHLGVAHSVEITRRGLRIFHGPSVVDEEISPFGCHRQVALVRYRPVLTPGASGAMATRHFLEVFAWTSVHRDGRPMRALTWVLMEVIGPTALHREMQVLAEVGSATWPPDHPAHPLPDTGLAPTADGAVAWRVPGRPTRSGLVEALRDTR
jgi:hypothetical protein